MVFRGLLVSEARCYRESDDVPQPPSIPPPPPRPAPLSITPFLLPLRTSGLAHAVLVEAVTIGADFRSKRYSRSGLVELAKSRSNGSREME
jgi:hypothetical protein